MLVQFTPVSSLTQEERTRLNQAIGKGLMHTAEAQKGYVMFEGKCIQLSELPAPKVNKQILLG